MHITKATAEQAVCEAVANALLTGEQMQIASGEYAIAYVDTDEVGITRVDKPFKWPIGLSLKVEWPTRTE